MRNIIITGGELFNKGAQAMTFVAVHEIKKRFPNHEVYLLSEMDLARSEQEKQQYAFNFMGWYPIKFARCQHNFLLRLLCKLRNGKELAEAEAIYKNCDAMIDISGYALGANWSDSNNNRYLDHLEFAASFGIPVYLMPQSFGPFEFGADRQALHERICRLLPTAKVIFAREQEGYDALVKTYGLTNVSLGTDLVLANKELDLNNVYKKIPMIDTPKIVKNSVALIPNSMTASVSSQEMVLAMYSEMIQKLLRLNKVVYLLSHSSMDADICRGLKGCFADNENVVLFDRDFSCLEFNELAKKFEYLVASRFHSIVHAYKNGVPCIALGWATKYHDLLKMFGQEDYVFDVRWQTEIDDVLKGIERMNTHYAEESEKIQSRRAEIQKENVFDVLTDGSKERK